MAHGKDSGILEIIAIGAIVFFMWKVTRKRITIPVSEEELTLADTCKNIVYKPLSPMETKSATLLGKGYCHSGDLKYSDYSQGSGDPYAQEQAEEYTDRKTKEAIRDINRKVIQFRLINTSAVPITTKVLDIDQDSVPFNPTPAPTAPNAPVAGSATSVTATGFTANWSASTGATGYYLDVATDITFTSYISGYQNKDVGNVISYAVTGLSEGIYYYRLRAYNDSGTSDRSNTVVADIYLKDIDGNIYTTVIIGSREFIIENYRATKYANGNSIVNITSDAAWLADITGAYCWYNNDISYKDVYGAFYNFYAIQNVNGLVCFKRSGNQESGWRVTTLADMNAVATAFGGVGAAGGHVKEAGLTHWNAPNTGADNTSGLTFRGSGYRGDAGAFSGIMDATEIWTSTEDVPGISAFDINLQTGSTNFNIGPIGFDSGCVVRCVRDI